MRQGDELIQISADGLQLLQHFLQSVNDDDLLMQRGAISQEDARKAKDYVRDLLYDALRDPDISVQKYTEQISTERVYEYCGISRTAKPRGRPPKSKAGEAP